MYARQAGSGDWYVTKQTTRGNGRISNEVGRNIFRVHSHSDSTGYTSFQTINFPKEFVGKWVRFKIELVDDD
jgi:hypothetical protein